MGEVVYLNGRIVPKDQALVSIDDRGFMYGDGVFETLRTYQKVPFRLGAHLNRLLDSLKALDIELSLTPQEIQKAVLETLRANDFDEAVIKITVTRGNSSKRGLFESGIKSNVIITASQLEPYSTDFYSRGVKVITVEDQRGGICNHKSLNYLPNVLARRSAEESQAFEAVMVTRRGFVTEGSVSNVFAVLDDIIMTPPADKKVLAGTTRQVVLELAKGLGFRLEEDALIKQDLFAASEVFLTNSLMEIMPVSQVDDSSIGDGRPGRLTSSLLENYRRFVDSWLDKVLTKS
ncbi:MAG: branched-chain amino acid aminotransferase [Actinobacteria bacterium]|nr:MAG: branched-chain amino acid aminotransferase [Actinomycetota bacterium]